jgi:urea transport system substrate-binding protein
MVGDYAAWNYFQSIDSEPNRDFVRKFKARYGADSVTSDTIAAAYNSVLLWAQSVTEAETDEVAAVLKAVRKQSMSAPEGVISIDAPTQHTWRPVYIGRIRGDGQFDIVWTSDKAVRPIPYPTSRSQAQWDGLVDELHRTWDGWANPGHAPAKVPIPGSAPPPPPVPRSQPAPPAAKPGSGRPAGPPPARKAGQAPAPRRSGPDQGVASRPVPARPIGRPTRRDALR